MKLNKSDTERFWSKVERLSLDECWPWKAGADKGYGRFCIGGRKRRRSCRAHRIAYVLEHGHFDQTLCVCHHCDNPPCCNPAHLFLGTRAQNLEDMHRKGRARTGSNFRERNGASKIDLETALLIRASSGKVRDIAKRFGIGKSQVSNIRRGVSGWTKEVVSD